MAHSKKPVAGGTPQGENATTSSKDARKPTETPRGEGEHRDGCLSHEDAVAASPADVAVAGEEDAGIGVEYLIRESEERAKKDG